MSHGVGLAEILRSHGQSYLTRRVLSATQEKAWRAIVACRTPMLGGHVECCDHCGVLRYSYHSCRNRHCPQCQTRAKEAWLAARQQELLPVPYFHLVFTLPHVINRLAGYDARTLYAMLFNVVSATLNEFAANPRWLGGMPSFTLVLHTWKQYLGRHIHIHALVAGGALTADSHWQSPRRNFLFPVRALSRVYRSKFMAALDVVRRTNGLRHNAAKSDLSWRNLFAKLRRHDWVVYAKQPLGGPAQVLEYLGRYTHRVAISNDRILSMTGNIVCFRMRDSANGNRKKVVRMEAGEFIGRFMQHILPKGFKRIRHYGLIGPAHKAANLAAARAALEAPTPHPATVESVEAFMQRVAQLEWMNCPFCRQGRFVMVEIIPPVSKQRCPSLRGPP
jgi:Putative transposase/Transposase zinc-binding domain